MTLSSRKDSYVEYTLQKSHFDAIKLLKDHMQDS